MWQPLVSSEWLHALGKHSFLLKAIRKERGKRGEELQTPFTYLGDELILFCTNGNREDPWKKINSISLFWKVKKALLASGNGLREGGSCIANVLQMCKYLSGLQMLFLSLKQNLQNSRISEFLASWPRCVTSAHQFPLPAERYPLHLGWEHTPPTTS